MEWTHFNRALVSLAWGSPQIKICLRVCWQAEGTDSFRQCHGDMVLTTSEEVVSRHTQLSIQSLWPMKPSSAGCGPTQSWHWALHLPVHPSDTGAGQSPAQPHCRSSCHSDPKHFKEPKELLILLVISVNIYCIRNLNQGFFKIVEPFHINIK